MHDGSDGGDASELLQAAFEPRADRWGEEVGGLVPLLRSLEHSWPHLFALAAARLGDAPRPWVPKDETEREVDRAYKKATLYLHPDRLAAARRDLSVRIEAEEVLKVLNKRHADKPSWHSTPNEARSAAAGGAPARSAGGSRTPAAPHAARSRSESSASVDDAAGVRDRASGAGLRDTIFGRPRACTDAQPPPRRAASSGASGSARGANPFAEDSIGAGGVDLRNDLFDSLIAGHNNNMRGERLTAPAAAPAPRAQAGRASGGSARPSAPPTPTPNSSKPFGDDFARAPPPPPPPPPCCNPFGDGCAPTPAGNSSRPRVQPDNPFF